MIHFLTVGEAAELLNVSTSFVADALRDGKLPYCQSTYTGGQRLISIDNLRDFKNRMIEESNKAIEELAILTQELNLP